VVAERLPDYLLPLTAREAGKVRNIQRYRSPEANCSIQRGDEKFQKIRKACEARRRRQHGAKSARRLVSPRQQQEADGQQNGCADSLQKTNVLDALEDDRQIDEPESQEADRSAVGNLPPGGLERRDQCVDGFAADPGLDAKPSTGNERAQNRSKIRTQHSERSARQHRKRNSITRSRMRVQQHWDENNRVAEKHGRHRLFPVHSSLDQAGR
jgi:hypothetical protein